MIQIDLTARRSRKPGEDRRYTHLIDLRVGLNTSVLTVEEVRRLVILGLGVLFDVEEERKGR